MPELGLSGRLRDLLASRRFTWGLTIALAVLVVLWFLFVTFLFNPFEEDLEDTASIVDRNVDYFLRWRGVGERFDSFPVPEIWTRFQETEVYEELARGGELADWDRALGVSEAVDAIARLAGNLPMGLDLERDLLREVALVGRGRPSLDASFDGMLMLRVSFKVKAGLAFLGFGFVQDRIPEGLGLQEVGDGRFKLAQFEPFGYQDAWLMRMRDVLLLASRPEWLDRARELEIRSGENSLGQAAVFHDSVTARLLPGDQPLEVFLRWEQVARDLGRWPDPTPASPYWLRVAGRFLDTGLLRNVAGFWLPGDRFLGRWTAEIDLGRASPFQQSWYESRPLSRNRIRELAEMVPADSFLVAAVAGNPGKVLLEMESALEPDVQQILDESILQLGGRFQGMADLLLNGVGEALQPGMLIALRRFEYPPDPERDVPHDDTPLPVYAIVAGLRDQAAYEEVVDLFAANYPRFTGEGKPAESVSILGRTRAIAFPSEAIPGTGEMVVMPLPARRAVVMTNSFRFMEQVVQAAFFGDQPGGPREQRQMALEPEFQEALEAMDAGQKVFLYARPREARHWLGRLAPWLADLRFRASVADLYGREWDAETLRQKEILFGDARASLTPEQQARLNQAVEQALDERYADLRRERLPGFEAAYRRLFRLPELVDWLAVGLQAGRRRLELVCTGRLALD